MNNRKMAATGILTILGVGIAVSLILSSKKKRPSGRNFLKKGSQLTEDLKGKFSEFVDFVTDKVKGIVN